jgi:hypothetical protein
MRLSGGKRQTQRLARSEQVLLADHFVGSSRSQAFGISVAASSRSTASAGKKSAVPEEKQIFKEFAGKGSSDVNA